MVNVSLRDKPAESFGGRWFAWYRVHPVAYLVIGVAAIAAIGYFVNDAIEAYHDRIALRGLDGKAQPVRLIVAGEPVVVPANMLRFRKHEPIAIQVLDPIEVQPAMTGLRGDVRLLDCEGPDGADITITPATLRAYAAAHERFCEALAQSCRSRGIPYFRAELGVPFDELVLRMFRLGGLLR